MNRRVCIAGVLVGLWASLHAGCASTPETNSPRTIVPTAKMLSGSWQVVSIQGVPLSAASDGARFPTATFEGDELGGSTGVNRYATTITLAERGEFSLAPTVMTKMAGPPEAMQVELRFVEALQESTQMRMQTREQPNQNLLLFLNASGSPTLGFQRTSPE